MWKRKTFQSGTWFPTGGRVEVTPGKSSKEVSLLSVIFHFFKTKLIFVQDVINVKISSICLYGCLLSYFQCFTVCLSCFIMRRRCNFTYMNDFKVIWKDSLTGLCHNPARSVPILRVLSFSSHLKFFYYYYYRLFIKGVNTFTPQRIYIYTLVKCIKTKSHTSKVKCYIRGLFN